MASLRLLAQDGMGRPRSRVSVNGVAECLLPHRGRSARLCAECPPVSAAKAAPCLASPWAAARLRSNTLSLGSNFPLEATGVAESIACVRRAAGIYHAHCVFGKQAAPQSRAVGMVPTSLFANLVVKAGRARPVQLSGRGL